VVHQLLFLLPVQGPADRLVLLDVRDRLVPFLGYLIRVQIEMQVLLLAVVLLDHV
jgi:hypothetical protein